MNTNVGDMPLEIFGDYVSEYLHCDFPWEYLFIIMANFHFGYARKLNMGITPMHSDLFHDYNALGNGEYSCFTGYNALLDRGCGNFMYTDAYYDYKIGNMT